MRRIDLTGARPRTSTGVLASIVAVAVTTALIYPLREVVPAVSTGVTYLIAVLLISTIWGLRLGLLTALLSALCFNFFHIPPTGRLSIAEGQNWVALAVFFVAAAIASTLAELARSRAEEAELGRREANLSADLARLLLVGVAPEQALDDVSKRLAGAMGIEWAVVAIRRSRREPPRCGRHPAGGRRRAARRRCSSPPTRPREARAAAGAGRAGARDAPDRGGRAPSPRRRGGRGAGAPPQRRAQDGPAALRLSRPADAAHLDRRGRGGARLGRDHRRGASRAGAGRPARVGPALAARRPAPRPLPARGGRGRSAPRVVLARGDRPGGGRSGPGRRASSSHRAGAAARQRRRRPARAGDRQRAREREGHSAGEPVSIHARAVGSRLVLRIVDRGAGRRRSRSSSGSSSRSTGGSPRARRVAAGSGLGLAIARGFVTANGGTIRAESLPGQGTAIVIELPVEAQPAGAPPRARWSGRMSGPQGARLRRRAADHPGAAGSSSARRASSSSPPPTARRRSTTLPCSRPTPRSSTSSFRTSTASR